jgi:hypothetical protein
MAAHQAKEPAAKTVAYGGGVNENINGVAPRAARHQHGEAAGVDIKQSA